MNDLFKVGFCCGNRRQNMDGSEKAAINRFFLKEKHFRQDSFFPCTILSINICKKFKKLDFGKMSCGIYNNEKSTTGSYLLF